MSTFICLFSTSDFLHCFLITGEGMESKDSPGGREEIEPLLQRKERDVPLHKLMGPASLLLLHNEAPSEPERKVGASLCVLLRLQLTVLLSS